LLPEDTPRDGREDLDVGVPPYAVDAVVDHHDPGPRRRHARKPASEEREYHPRLVPDAQHAMWFETEP
jgi:hypothetical protein